MAHDDGGDDQTTVTVKADEYDKLTRSAMLQDLKEDLEKWGKTRFGIMLIVVAISGFVGIQAIGFVVVNGILGSKIDEATASAVRLEVTEARVTADSTKAVEEARAATKDALLALAELSSRADDLDEKFTGIAAKADAASENVRADARLEIAGLQEQLDALATNVDTAFAAVRRSLNDIDAIPSAELFTQQTAVRETFQREKIAPFQGRSEILVPITSSVGADPARVELAVGSLRKLGYRSSVRIIKFIGNRTRPTLVVNRANGPSREITAELESVLRDIYGSIDVVEELFAGQYEFVIP